MDKIGLVQKFNGLSILQKVGLFLVLTLGMGGAYWYFILDDKLIEITKVQHDIERLDKDIARFRVQVAKLPELEKNLDFHKKELFWFLAVLSG